VRIGNEPSIVPGSEDTYASYGRAWANLSNTPFRYYKQWTHEGGISTPFIVHWPRGNLRNGWVSRTPCQLVDVLPTVMEATGAAYPRRYDGRAITPYEGRSLLAALRGNAMPEATLYWEHTGNAAIRRARWKMVRHFPGAWELYDMACDRSELHDVAHEHPDVVDALRRDWQAWADRVGVIPWQGILDLYRERGQPAREAIG
jgi:arylsulfatase A-like enzyme